MKKQNVNSKKVSKNSFEVDKNLIEKARVLVSQNGPWEDTGDVLKSLNDTAKPATNVKFEKTEENVSNNLN